MDEFLILLQAKLDEAKSQGNINTDIDNIQKQIDKLLEIKAEIDPKSISSIINQMSKLGIQVGQDFYKAFNNGLSSIINTKVLSQINKISDSSTSTIVQNEKKKQEAYKATSDAVVYHAGVISKLNKAETNGRFYGSSRGTGYFGTGYYFVDSNTKHELDNNSSYSKLPYTSVDISKYDNLFKATNDEVASKLHNFLENLTRFTQGSDKFNIDELFSQFKNVFTDTSMDIKAFGDKMEQLKAFMSNSSLSDRSDSVSTQFMKSLGYGGVDTRGTKYADTRYGTVIYDLKEESVLQANITDELQKQGQMLEKINYEKGQVFDASADAKIQAQIQAQERLAEIKAEFNNSFNRTNLDSSETELNNAQKRLTEINNIIADCQHGIDNADEAAKKFAKDMSSLGLDVSDAEMREWKRSTATSYQKRIDELSLERAELEKKIPILEEVYDKESQLANEAYKQAEQIVDRRRQEAQQSSSTANEVVQNEEKKQQAIQETVKVQEQLRKNGNIIQQTDFATSFNTKDEAEKYFNILSKTVSVQEKLGENKNLESFIVEVKNADGVVEKLTFKYNKLTEAFEYSGGSVNDNGIIKQMNMISAKADSLQTKLDKLKANYSDTNASRPIKDSINISALSEQYNKVLHAIENVRNADNTTFSSMVSNAQNEISVLESMVAQFKNAENVATQMKSVDISSGIAQAQERLGKLKADSTGFEQMTQTIMELDKAITNVGDKSSLDTFINKLRVAETQLSRVQAETKSIAQVNKIQLSIDTNGYDSKVESLISRTQQWTDEFGNARINTDQLSKSLELLNAASKEYSANPSVETAKALADAEAQLDVQVKKVTNSISLMNSTTMKSSAVDSLRQKYQEFYDKNGAAHRQWGIQLKQAMLELASGAEISKVRGEELKQELIQIQNAARQAGKLGQTAFKEMISSITSKLGSLTYYFSASFMLMKGIQSIKSGISSVKALDTALVDLKKTTTMTASELEDFYYASNKVAKQMGATTEEIISQAAEFSRLGYSSKEAASQMAKYSSWFKTISPGMSIEQAGDTLTSVMKAFKYDVQDVEKIMSMINTVGNNFAVSNLDISEILTRSSSAMMEANNSLADTIALGTAA